MIAYAECALAQIACKHDYAINIFEHNFFYIDEPLYNLVLYKRNNQLLYNAEKLNRIRLPSNIVPLSTTLVNAESCMTAGDLIDEILRTPKHLSVHFTIWTHRASNFPTNERAMVIDIIEHAKLAMIQTSASLSDKTTTSVRAPTEDDKKMAKPETPSKPEKRFTLSEMLELLNNTENEIHKRCYQVFEHMLKQDPEIRRTVDLAVKHKSIQFLDNIDVEYHCVFLEELFRVDIELGTDYIIHFAFQLTEINNVSLKRLFDVTLRYSTTAFKIAASACTDYLTNLRVIAGLLMENNNLYLLRWLIRSAKTYYFIPSMTLLKNECGEYLEAIQDTNIAYAVSHDYTEMVCYANAKMCLSSYVDELKPAMKALYETLTK